MESTKSAYDQASDHPARRSAIDWGRLPAAMSKLRSHAQPGLLLLAAIIVIAIVSHSRHLTSIPRGFHIDESSVGYNAELIARTGHDEHGESFPLFFKAFGEYKNPLYIYLAALLVKVAGLSNAVVRATSCVCWLLGTFLFALLGRRLWNEHVLHAFWLVSLAFTPSIFCLSRVSFEVISLYPVLAAFMLCVHHAFEGGSVRWAFAAGVAIGLATYAYTTFRLLAPFHCALVVACYARREHWQRLAAFAAGAALTVVPFAVYLLRHGENLTHRMREIGFIHRDISVLEKLSLFWERYVHYFSPKYLLSAGDTNLRHHSGFGGELFLPSALALGLAVLFFLSEQAFRADRYRRFLLGGLLLSPIAAALTDDFDHSLRAFSLAVFAIPLSVIGVQRLMAMSSVHVAWVLTLALSVNAGLFVRHYFDVYPQASIPEFGNFGLQQAVRKALKVTTGRVVIEDAPHQWANINSLYIGSVMRERLGAALPPIVSAKREALTRGDTFVFRWGNVHRPDLHDGLPDGTTYVMQPFDAWQREHRRKKH